MRTELKLNCIMDRIDFRLNDRNREKIDYGMGGHLNHLKHVNSVVFFREVKSYSIIK